MDGQLRVHSKSPKETNKSKKKPIKVVHISTPMRVETSESDFRNVVQELTGQDSNVADTMAKYPYFEPGNGSRMTEATEKNLLRYRGPDLRTETQSNPYSYERFIDMAETQNPLNFYNVEDKFWSLDRV